MASLSPTGDVTILQCDHKSLNLFEISGSKVTFDLRVCRFIFRSKDVCSVFWTNSIKNSGVNGEHQLVLVSCGGSAAVHQDRTLIPAATVLADSLTTSSPSSLSSFYLKSRDMGLSILVFLALMLRCRF